MEVLHHVPEHLVIFFIDAIAPLFQHLAFIVRCLSSQSQFVSMPIFHH